MAQALQKAGKLFEQQHWAEARAAYDGARGLERDWSAPPVRLAVEGAVACSLKLQTWDDALSRAAEFVTRAKGTFAEAVGERFLGGLYLSVPHYGTKRGTTFLRGQWVQGVQVHSWRKDAKDALKHYERARELLLALPAKAEEEKKLVNAERIGLDFDTAAALASESQNGYRYGRWGWYGWWWDNWLEPEEDSEAVEEADYEETRWGFGRGGWGGEDQQTPTGIPLGPDGKPQFIQVPKEYSAQLGKGPKIRFLLDEIQRLDSSEKLNDAARALFRWAMIARTLYGPDWTYEQRGELNNYGRALLVLALYNDNQADNAKTVLRNILQFIERDDSNDTAWVRTPETYWWYWWNNDIEVNAWALKALVTLEPQSELAPRLVKWLLNNRRNGYYWRSTRDTALVIAAMTNFMRASGESAPDYTLTVSVDGRPMKEITLTKTNFFTLDNQLLLHGLQLDPGPHKVTLSKQGKGALYYSAYLSYFTKEEDVKGAGNEILVERQYFKLVPRTESVRKPGKTFRLPGASHPASEAEPAEANARVELRDIYARVPLKNGDAVASGDKIEVVLKLTAKNSYDYLAFEDMKPAGCEPMELRSGGRWAGGLCANLELRDEKVVFFIGLLEQGQHVLRYKLRAEPPGHFHALPARGFAMYAPEVKAISDEMRLQIKE